MATGKDAEANSSAPDKSGASGLSANQKAQQLEGIADNAMHGNAASREVLAIYAQDLWRSKEWNSIAPNLQKNANFKIVRDSNAQVSEMIITDPPMPVHFWQKTPPTRSIDIKFNSSGDVTIDGKSVEQVTQAGEQFVNSYNDTFYKLELERDRSRGNAQDYDPAAQAASDKIERGLKDGNLKAVISVVKDLQAQPDLRPRVASTLTDNGISSQWIAKSGKGEVLQITPAPTMPDLNLPEAQLKPVIDKWLQENVHVSIASNGSITADTDEHGKFTPKNVDAAATLLDFGKAYRLKQAVDTDQYQDIMIRSNMIQKDSDIADGADLAQQEMKNLRNLLN
jgi:hypothetical protein